MNLSGIIHSVGDLATGGTGMGALTIDTVCAEADPVDPSALSCKSLSPSGKFDMALLRSYKEKNRTALSSLNCKKGKMMAIQGELQCLSNQAGILSQQISTLQSAYTQNIQRMQQDVQKMNAILTDRVAQMEDVTAKLGDGEKGSAGMLQMRENIKGLVAGIPKEVAMIKERQKKAADDRKALQEQAQVRTMALTNDCFKKRTKPSFQCEKNGAPVSAYEYVLCRYQQNEQVSKKGAVETDSLTKSRAEANAKGLAAVLDGIFNDSPKNPNMPSNQQEQQQAMTAVTTITTAADIEAQYGNLLRRYDSSRTPVHDFVIGELTTCYKRSESIVSKEKNRPSSELTLAAQRIKSFETETSTMATELMNKYSQTYTEALASMTGGHYSMDLSTCQNAKPEVVSGCFDKISSTMSGVLDSKPIGLIIKGSDAKNNIAFKCAGLNGCITKLQQVRTNLKSEFQRVDTYKKNYVTQANQNVEKFTKSMAQNLSVQSQQLDSRMKQLNGALASLGISSMVNLGSVEGEQLEFQEPDNLVKPPKNVLNLIGGQMNPPMLNVTGSSFTEAQGALGAEIKQIEKDEISKVKDSDAKLVELSKECTENAISDKLAAAQRGVDELNSRSCVQAGMNCGQGDKFEDLLATLQGMDGMGQIDSTELMDLSTGISDACTPATVDKKWNDKAQRDKCAKQYPDPSPPVRPVRTEGEADEVFQDRMTAYSTMSMSYHQKLYEAPNNRDACFRDAKIAYDEKAAERSEIGEMKSRQCAAIFTGIESKVRSLGKAIERADSAAGAVK
jgi:hypothetical protein